MLLEYLDEFKDIDFLKALKDYELLILSKLKYIFEGSNEYEMDLRNFLRFENLGRDKLDALIDYLLIILLSHTPYFNAFVRKYAENEPTVNINSSGTGWIVVKITHPNNHALNNFQVKIPNSDLNYLITQKNEPLTIKDLTNGDEGNQPVKSPIPPLAIIIVLIAIPIIALRKLN